MLNDTFRRTTFFKSWTEKRISGKSLRYWWNKTKYKFNDNLELKYKLVRYYNFRNVKDMNKGILCIIGSKEK